MTIKSFFIENGIFIIIPLAAGLLKFIHDSLPTEVFLGGLAFCLVAYVAINQLKKSQADRADAQFAESTAAVIKDMERGEKKKKQANRDKAEKQRQRQQAKQRLLDRNQSHCVESPILDSSSNSSNNNSAGNNRSRRNTNRFAVAANVSMTDEDFEDNDDASMLRLAALQNKRK